MPSRARNVRVALILSGLVLGSGLEATEPEKDPPPSYVSVGTVKGWLGESKPVTFLDVREADEFAAAHLPGAVSISYAEVASLAPRLPHDSPIVLYCIHSSHRAPAAARTLRKLGFENALVLEGGIVAWEAGGQTILASELGATPKILPVTNRCGKLAEGGH